MTSVWGWRTVGIQPPMSLLVGWNVKRMVKSTKRCFKKIIGQARLLYNELPTAITEVEMIINSRSLSYVSGDDIESPLSPSHLIIEKRMLSLPDNPLSL